jgi:hypothetical protein
LRTTSAVSGPGVTVITATTARNDRSWCGIMVRSVTQFGYPAGTTWRVEINYALTT